MRRLLPSIYLLCTLIILTQPLKAQFGPGKQWDKTLGGIDGDGLFAIKQTLDGGYILGGSSDSNISGDKTQNSIGQSDYWVVKIDSLGNKQWDKTFGGNNKDDFTCIYLTVDGGYILGGTSNSGISGDKIQASRGQCDYWVIKLDPVGNKIWDRTFGGSDQDFLQSIQQTSDGSYVLGGYSKSGISGEKSQANKDTYLMNSFDYWIIKIDNNGNKVWDKTIGGASSDMLYSFIQTPNGGLILGGMSESGISGDKTQSSHNYTYDYWVVKLDRNGNKIWDKTFGGDWGEDFRSMQLTTDGGYILGGFSVSGISGDKSENNIGGYDFWVVKIDSVGNKQWDKTLGGSSGDYLSSLYPTSDGGFLVAGESYSTSNGTKTAPNKGASDYWVVKLDANGNKKWDRSFGGNMEDRLFDVQPISNGWYILAGSSESDIFGDKSQPNKGGYFSDYWVVKLGPKCSDLTASLNVACTASGQNVNVSIIGMESTTPSLSPWTLIYTIDGVTQTATGTTANFFLAQNSVPGSVFSLVSITSGSCTTNLSNSVTIQPIPNTLSVPTVSRCGNGTVNLLATGAPLGGSYIWYTSASGGAPVFISTTGTFTTPVLSTTTTYFVAVSNTNGCEGPRTPVTAIINQQPLVSIGPNEVVCAAAAPFQLAGFSPQGGIWSGPGVNGTGIFTPSASLAGYQTLTYSVTQNGCTVSASKQVFIPVPLSKPVINFISPDTLIASVIGPDYEWYRNGIALSTTTRKLKALSSGMYSVKVKDLYNCTSPLSLDYGLTISGTPEARLESNLIIYPNPNNGKFIINLVGFQGTPIEVTIFDLLARVVLRKELDNVDRNSIQEFDLSSGKGMYILQLKTGEQIFNSKIVVE